MDQREQWIKDEEPPTWWESLLADITSKDRWLYYHQSGGIHLWIAATFIWSSIFTLYIEGTNRWFQISLALSLFMLVWSVKRFRDFSLYHCKRAQDGVDGIWDELLNTRKANSERFQTIEEALGHERR